jgi:pimeloyl-ACP methyl ester carboxylesterase
MESPVQDQRGEVAGLETFWREAPARGDHAPVLYVHGNPTNSDDWVPFLERTGGLAPDLPGFGRSAKPAQFDYSIEGYSDWLDAFLADRGVERYSLVVHDWGAAALGLAQRAPERVERLVVMNAVPLLPGYRWHRLAKIWRTPIAGELFMGLSTRWGLKQLSREGTVAPGPAPDELIDRIWQHFDHGTQRAILKLYRSAPTDVLAQAGERLGEIRAPALVLWGAQDPYISTHFARAYADALGGPTRLEFLEDASHWPWLDRPEAIERVTGFALETT